NFDSIKFILRQIYLRKEIPNYRFLILIYSTFHLYTFYRSLLDFYKPKNIFFSNDHTPAARALLIAAKDLSIKTIYLQHAAVSTIFPPLNFSLSLLDGQYS